MNICFLGCKDKELICKVSKKITNSSIFEFESIDYIDHRLTQTDILVVGRDPIVSKDLIDKLLACKIIVRNGIGFNNIDTRYAREKGISVYNVSQYCISDVAEHTFALLLNYTRNIEHHTHVHACWGKSEVPNIRLRGKKLGIVGLGRIGQCVAEIAVAFGLEVAFYDPYISSNQSYERYQTLKMLIQNCDFISIHVPYTDETNKLIGFDVLDDANGVVIINTSRGKVVDSEAVLFGLKNGKVKAFLSDVMETEPPTCNELYNTKENYPVFVTPHVAFDSVESENDLHMIICDIIETSSLETCIYNPIN